MTHSIAFACAVAAIAMLFANRKPKFISIDFFMLFLLTTVSHAFIDACTSGGLGVALFSPYNTGRYFFPWRPIQVSPMGLKFFSVEGLQVLWSEFCWVLIPCAVFYVLRKLAGRVRLFAS